MTIRFKGRAPIWLVLLLNRLGMSVCICHPQIKTSVRDGWQIVDDLGPIFTEISFA